MLLMPGDDGRSLMLSRARKTVKRWNQKSAFNATKNFSLKALKGCVSIALIYVNRAHVTHASAQNPQRTPGA
jgi:hypothetical protein